MKDIIDSFEGMNGLVDPSKLKKSELALIENFTLKSYGNVGSLVSRNGFTRYNSNQIASGGSGVGSMFEATINGTDYIIANIINGSSSALYYEDSPYTGAWTSITGSNGTGRAYKLNYASFRDKVYVTNNTGGTSSNTVWDGTTAGFYDMGCPPPSSRAMSLASSNSNGRLTVNSGYFYYVTFLYDGFQESPIMSYASISTGASDDTVTITNIPTAPLDGVANARITARKLYRLKASTGVAYYLDTITNNTDTTYIDYKADNELAITIDLDAYHVFNVPYYSKYISLHKERSILGRLYSPNIFTAPTGADITLTGSDTGGSVGNGIYKYRFYFANEIYDGGNNYYLYLTPYVEKTIDMSAFSGTDNSISINFGALTDRNWFDSIYIERTSSGGSDFIRVANVAFTAGSYTDTTADGARGITTVGFILTKVEDTELDFPNNIIVSDAGKPDLFSTIETAQDGTLIPAGNEWNVGEPITGIHSEENRIVIFGNKNIYELDTTAQSRQFWRLNKIVSGIGADDGLQCQVGTGYVFVMSGKKQGNTAEMETIYYWDGRSKPVAISDTIQPYLWGNYSPTAISEYLSITYDPSNNLVWFITSNNIPDLTWVLIYDLTTGLWEVISNSVNLNFKTSVYSKNYGVLIGGGDGYVHYQKQDTYQDVIAGTNRTFTTKLRTKTYEAYDRDFKPRRFRADITTNGAVTPSLKTAVDGTLNSGDSMTALASGFNRPNQVAFTNAQDKYYRQVYFQLEMTANVQQKVHGLLIELDEKSEASGGR